MAKRLTDEYVRGVKAAAFLLAKAGMDDGPKHLARYLLRTLLTVKLIDRGTVAYDCEKCGHRGITKKDILPRMSAYCSKCHYAIWPPKYRYRKPKEK